MAKNIEVKDCLELKAKFDKYCETAGQHEFAMLFIIDTRLKATVEKIVADGEVKNQKDIRAMFRVVLKIIGEDYSEYIET